MRRYFEEVYENFCDNMEEFCDLAHKLLELVIQAIVTITLPLWIIPYAICKKIREGKGWTK